MNRLKLTLAATLLSGFAARALPGGTPVEDALLRAEAHFVDGRIFEASASYREALGGFLGLPAESRPQLAPEMELALHRLEELGEDTGDSVENAELLARIAALEGAGSPLEASAVWCLAAQARYDLGYALLDTGATLGDAVKTWKPLGILTRFHVVGSFDNERGGQFATDLGPEKELRLDATYQGKKRTIRWRELPRAPLGGYVDLASLFKPNEECLAYAVTFVEAQADTEVALRFGSDEGFRVWVNGALAASEDVHRRHSFDQNAVGIPLRKGWNSILLKITQSSHDWGFTARLTRLDGAPLDGVVEGSPPPDAVLPRVEGDVPVIACPTGSRAILEARIESEPAVARPQYLLGALLLEKGAHDASEHPDTKLLTRAVQIDAAQSVYHLFLARSEEREATIAAQKDDNAWRRSLEKAAAIGSAQADYLLADYYKSTFGSLNRASTWLDRALERYPEYESALLLEGQIDENLGVPWASKAATESVAKLARPTVHARASRADRLTNEGKLEEAEAALRSIIKVCRSYGQGSTLASLAHNLLHRERVDDALAILESRLALDPFDTDLELDIARALEGRGRLDDALARVGRAIEICPEDHELHREAARLSLRLGKKDDALASLDRALELQPNLPEVREYVELIRATKSGFEDAFRRDVAAVRKAALENKGEKSAGGEPARILLDLTAIQVNRDGTTKTFSQNLVQVLNERGIRMYDSFRSYYARGEQVLEFKKAKVWHPDGTSADAKLARFGFGSSSGNGEFAGASVDMPTLGVGDVIEVEYVKEDLAQSYFGDYFGHREVFQESIPILEKALTLRVPADRKFFFRQRNMKAQAEESRDKKSGTITYSWSMRDVPKLDQEPGMPEPEEVSPVLEVSTFETWDAFNKWYWNLIKKQLESSPEISKKVRELTSGADTDLAKIGALYNFVVTDVRYNAWEFGVHGFKPYNAATIFARRFGDCKDKAILLSVMLREAGIKAQPVLIKADDRRGSEDLTLPMVNHFNHCIAYVPAANGREELFLDGTAQFHNARELPSMDRGATVLVVGENSGAIKKVPWNAPQDLSITEEATVTIRPDLGAELQVRAQPTGDYAVFVRQHFEIETQRREQLEKMYGKRFASSAVKSETFSNLLKLDEPVAFGVTVDVPRFVVEAPEGLSIRAMEDFFGSGTNLGALGSLEARSFDVLLGNPRSSALKTVYLLPEGIRVKSLPPAHDVSSRFGRLKIAYEEAGPRKLIAHRLIEVTSPRVSVADYADFRDFAATVGRLEDEKIVLERS